MPFPFWPGGAIFAVVVLSGVIAIFGLALRAIDRAATRTTTSIALGIARGIRGWAAESGSDVPVPASPAGPEPRRDQVEDLAVRPNIPLQRVVRR
jgi:hypothetical protein